MRISIASLENFTTRRSVYCAWVPACEGQPTPLVARWIDPEAETQEQDRRVHPGSIGRQRTPMAATAEPDGL